MRIVKADLSQPILLGQQGEHGVTQVVFDLSGYIKTYGDGVAQLIVKRPTDPLEYPGVLTRTENTATWEIGLEWTEFSGQGWCQLNWYVDDGLAKSDRYKTAVYESLGAGEAPEPQQGYLDQVLASQTKAEGAAQQAKASALETEVRAKRFDEVIAANIQAIQDAATQAQDSLQDEVTRVEGFSANPPKVGDNGNWWTWDGTQYVDTGYEATGSQGVGIASIKFNDNTWRWEICYTDGHVDSFPGDNPAETDKWTMFRDDFETYDPGDDAFRRQAGGGWRFLPQWDVGAHHDIAVAENGSKYLRLRMTEAEGRVATAANYFIRGEAELQFDYMPTLPVDGGITDFMDVWALGSTVRARVNYRGKSVIYVDTNEWNMPQSDPILDANGNIYRMKPGVWYRVKVSVKVGRVIMKLWARDTEAEPEGEVGAGITTLANITVLTASRLYAERELAIMYGPMNAEPVGGAFTVGFDNLMVWRSKIGSQGEQGIQGIQGEPGRGVVGTVFDNSVGRWVTTFTDGTSISLAGYDPSNCNVYSMFREDFRKYAAGENSFGAPGVETPDWRISDTYVTGVGYDIGEDEKDRFAIIRCDGGAGNRAAWTIEHDVQGETVLEFDYMPMTPGVVTPGTTATDFFEVWLTGSSLRARVNFNGRSLLYADTSVYKDLAVNSYVYNGGTTHYPFTANTWYRVKIHTQVGKVTMKIWKRDTETEPALGAPGTLMVESAYLTADLLNAPREYRNLMGPINAAPPEGGWFKMGYGNVKVYRDIADEIAARVLAALAVNTEVSE